MSQAAEAQWEQHNEAGCRYFGQGAYADAEQEFLAAIREATALGAENLRLASSLSNLGQLKYRQRDFARAEELFRRALIIREHALGADHYGVVQSVNNLAALHYARGELEAAEPLFRRALELSDRHLGREHPDVATALNNLARLCFRRNDFAAAAPLLTRLLALKEAERGPDHPEVATILASLARVRCAAHQYDAAEPLARRALAIREHAVGPDNPTLAANARLLAEICAARGKPDEARRLRERPQADQDDAQSSLAFVHGAEPIEPPVLDRTPHHTPPPRVSPPALARPDVSIALASAPPMSGTPTPAPAPPSTPQSAPASESPAPAVTNVPPLVLQPFPDSVLPVGDPSSHDPTTSDSSRHQTTRPPDDARHLASRDAHAHDAPHRPATARVAHASADRPSNSRETSLFGALFKLVFLLAIIAGVAWFVAGRPPLQSVLSTITRVNADSARVDSTHPPSDSTPQP